MTIWKLEINGKLTDIGINADRPDYETILLALEGELIDYDPDTFPYDCYDVDIVDECEEHIDIEIIHENDATVHTVEPAVLRKV
ncbi:hypothetical protein [Vibrio phage RYC]|nr:hypothetical protein [Vibrio phage RYC]